MLTVAKIVAVMIALGGLALWVISAIPPIPKPPPLSEVPEAVVEVPLPNNDNGRITVEGVVVQGGSPPVPYIEYQQEDGSVRTKQLIPQGGRGCSPDAGDLPCADGSRDNYPNLNFGDRIRVSGTINGDQLLVTSVERL